MVLVFSHRPVGVAHGIEIDKKHVAHLVERTRKMNKCYVRVMRVIRVIRVVSY